MNTHLPPRREPERLERFASTKPRWRLGASVVVMLALTTGLQPTDVVASGEAVGPAKAASGGGVESSVQARAEAYTRLARAVIAVRGGEIERAVDELKRASEIAPDSPDLLYEAADLLFEVGRASEAQRLADRALTLDPAHGPTLQFLAERATERALGEARDPEAVLVGIQLYERLLALPEAPAPAALEMLARLKLQIQDLPGAIEVVRRLVALRPGDLMATRTLAQLLLRDRQEAEALRVMLRFVAAHPDEIELLAFVDQLARALNAWPIVDEELARIPDESAVTGALWRFLGEARLRLGRPDEAVVALERAVAMEPEMTAARSLLARAYRATHRTSEAIELLQAILAANPADDDAWFELAQTLEARREIDAAIAAYREILSRVVKDPRAAEARVGIGQRLVSLELSRGRIAEARRALELLAPSDDPETLELHVRVAIEDRKLEDARRGVRRLRNGGQDGVAALLEGEIDLLDGRWSRAEVHFTEAIAALGPVARRRAAALYADSDKPQIGESLLRQWVEILPESADAHFYLGDFLYQQDRWEEAERTLRAALRIDPHHAPALNFLGYSFAERDERLEEALDLVQRALSAEPNNAMYLDSLGWVFYRLGRFADAREPLERASREIPNDPTILSHLGDIYWALDLRDRAIEVWGRALAAKPEDAAQLEEKIRRHRSNEGEGPGSAAELRGESRAEPAPLDSLGPSRPR